jgi:hypothetical protein
MGIRSRGRAKQSVSHLRTSNSRLLPLLAKLSRKERICFLCAIAISEVNEKEQAPPYSYKDLYHFLSIAISYDRLKLMPKHYHL